MTTARKRLVDPAVTRWYHCISRCTRRHRLLKSKGRKRFLKKRLQELAKLFAVAVSGFSILDNHFHLLLRLDPEMAKSWSDEEVARRWGELYPPRKRRKQVPVTDEWIQERVQDADWIAKRRDWLQSLSWFHKCLKEPLARMANKEDDCDGAFFASRFKSIAILDEQALLEVCAYVDLNPFAAGITFLPEDSPDASVGERIEHAWPKMTREDFLAALGGLTLKDLPGAEAEQDHWLCPLDDRRAQGSGREGMLDGLSLPKYLLLLDHTARLFREDKARLSDEVAGIFERLGTTAEIWEQGITQLKQRFENRKLCGRAFATTRQTLLAAAERLGVRRLLNLTSRETLPQVLPPSMPA